MCSRTRRLCGHRRVDDLALGLRVLLTDREHQDSADVAPEQVPEAAEELTAPVASRAPQNALYWI